MINIKKKINNKWVVIGNDNNNITKLLDEQQKAIKKLQHNVSWLALHGGGGSGNGGGSAVTKAECDISVNNILTTSESKNIIIKRNDIISITLISKDATLLKPWTVTVTINGQIVTVKSINILQDDTITLSYDVFSKYLVNYQIPSFKITASYTDDDNAVYGSTIWIGSITESAVDLYVDDSLKFDLSEINNSSINIAYQSPITGNYTLKMDLVKEDDSTIFNSVKQNINITNSQLTQITYQLTNLFNGLNLTDDNKIGVFNINYTLYNNDDASISINIKRSIIILANTIIIASSVLSTDKNNPTNVNSIGYLNLYFIAYYNGSTTYTYNARINNKNIFENDKLGIFGEVINQQIKPDDSWELNKPIEIIIDIKTPTVVSKTYYIYILKGVSKYIKLDETKQQAELLGFFAIDYNKGNSIFNLNNKAYNYNSNLIELSSKINLYNSNDLCVINAGTELPAPYLRISNGCYGVIENLHSNNVDIPDSFYSLLSNEFTINIVFKADYHPDDERTILLYGNVNSKGIVTQGISIDVHNIYIGQNSIYEINDNIINDITIIYKKIQEENDKGIKLIKYIIKLYIDGVLSYINKLDTPLFGNDNKKPSKIYLCCKPVQNGIDIKYSNLCDCNLYALNIYNTELTDFDIYINYINNKIRTNCKEGLPDFNGILKSELPKSFCYYDEDEQTIKSILYNQVSNSYDITGICDSNGLQVNNLKEYSAYLKIPILYLDFSGSSQWTYKNFVANQTKENLTLNKATNVKFQYWDPISQKLISSKSGVLDADLQGTSTLLDSAKNLELEFHQTNTSSAVFIPKADWFPEQNYTLKADVVDSGHCNNAAIGGFINDILGDIETDGKDPWLDYDENAINNIKNSTYKKKQQPTATLKHTVEGFPVFLIIKFTGEAGKEITTTPVGIYSFNLGRGAVHNLGFKNLQSLTVTQDDGSSITPTIDKFPFYAENALLVDDLNNTVDGVWIEGNTTSNIKGMDQMVNTFDPDLNTSECDFWQYDKNIINFIFEVKYHGDPNKTLPSQYNKFMSAATNIAMLPIEGFMAFNKTSSGDVYGGDISTGQRAYTIEINETQDENGNKVNSYNWKAQIDESSKKPIYINKTQIYNDLPESLGISIKSAAKYFVVALLFGLKDNFGKNISYRAWGDNDFIPDFYDLDCGFADSNQGQPDVTPDLWLKYLYNNKQDGVKFGYLTETFDRNKTLVFNDKGVVTGKCGSTQVVSACYNKLWLSLDTKLVRQKYADNIGRSIYCYYWSQLRNKLDEVIGNDVNKTKVRFGDWFMDNYFIPQMNDCGPLLFNLDYKLKYLLQFDGNYNNYTSSKDMTKLHGRKISLTRNWLNKHLDFLDSVFYVRNPNESTAKYYNNVKDAAVTANLYGSPREYPVRSNCPIVFNNSIGQNTNTFYMLPENVYTYIDGAASGESAIAWKFTSANHLINIGNDDVPMNKLKVDNFNYSKESRCLSNQGLPALTDLNLFGLTSLLQTFNLDAFKTGEVSELRNINLSNTSGNTFGFNSLIDEIVGDNGQKAYSTVFNKLTSINISNSSSITEISIPSIPLNELKLTYSSLTKFELKDQKYIKNVDLTGCTNISSVTLNNCEKYEELVLDNYPELETLKVINCPSIKKILIHNCNNLNTVNIEYCSSLTEIYILNCKGLIGNAKNNVIQNCPSLVTLSYEYCDNLTHIKLLGDFNNLKELHINNTNVYNIVTSEDDDKTQHIVDLRKLNNLKDFNFNNNNSIEIIKLPNNKTKPINFNYPITNCLKLKQIFGHFSLNYYNQFYNCPNYSVFNRKTTWKNSSITDTENGFKTPWEILKGTNFNNYNIITIDDVFDTSSDAVNIRFNNTDEHVIKTYNQENKLKDNYYSSSTISVNNILNNSFYITNMSVFDIYYILFVLALSKRKGIYNGTCELSHCFTTYNKDSSGNNSALFNLQTGINMSRYMFYGLADVITYIYQSFYTIDYTGNKYIYLPAPEYKLVTTSEGIKYTECKNNGIFSFIPNVTLLSFIYNTLVFDQHLFTGFNLNNNTINKDYYNKLNNLYLNSGFIACNGNQEFIKIKTNINNIANWIISEDANPSVNYSNTSEMFKCMPVLDTLYLFNPLFLDYNNIRIPYSVSKIYRSFNTSCGSGSIDLTHYGSVFFTTSQFKDSPEVTHITNSFNVYNDSTTNTPQSSYVTMELSDTTFEMFPKLSNIGSAASDGIGNNISNTSFNGSGIKKTFKNDEFPYKIFSNLPELKYVNGLFTNVEANNYKAPYNIPGTLFENNTKLEYANNLFADVKFHYTLTSNGFAKCTNLTDVSGMFKNSSPNYAEPDTETNIYLHGSIPYRLFYHGHTIDSTTWWGYNNDWPTKPTFNQSDDNWKYVTIVNSPKIILNNHINNMSYCFSGNLGLNEYTNDGLNIDMTIESNPDYYAIEDNDGNITYPRWIYNSETKQWFENNPNNHKLIGAWFWDGRYETYQENYEYFGADCPEDDNIYINTKSQLKTDVNNVKLNTNNFCCAPDLLRYCTSSAGINNMFDGCGFTGADIYGNYKLTDNNFFNYGLRGRIPDYLFKPVPNVQNLDCFFRSCHNISAFMPKNSILPKQIPTNLFKYQSKLISMQQMFAYNWFERGIDLNNIFTPLQDSPTVNGKGLFFNSVWGGLNSKNQDWVINNIFDNIKFNNINGMFSTIVNTQPDTVNIKANDYYQKSVYFNHVKLNDVLQTVKLNNNLSTGVFYGWMDVTTNTTSSSTVTAVNTNKNIQNVLNFIS